MLLLLGVVAKVRMVAVHRVVPRLGVRIAVVLRGRVVCVPRLHRHGRLRASYRVLDTEASKAAAEFQGWVRASRTVVLGILRVSWRLASVCLTSITKVK